MADWKDIAALVSPFAPTAGKILGGMIPFPGGAMMGEMVGNMIARQFNVEPTPEAVREAIVSNPAHVTAGNLANVEEEAGKWAAMAQIVQAEAGDRTAQSQAVNETMRQEIARVSWWHWRHLMGYSTLVWSMGLFVVVMKALWYIDIAAINAFTQVLGPIVLILGILAGLNGFVAQTTSSLKEAAITGLPKNSALGKVVEVVTTRRK